MSRRDLIIGVSILVAVWSVLSFEQILGSILVAEKKIEIGVFEIDSESLIVSDPGYSVYETKEGLYATTVSDVRPGQWSAHVISRSFLDGGGATAAELVCVMVEYEGKRLRWERREPVIGVDSGRAGFYTKQAFQNNLLVPKDLEWPKRYEELNPKYLWDGYCSFLLDNRPGALLPGGGVVSHSGYGDGGYPLFVSRDPEGRVIALRILYVNRFGRG